LKKLLIRINAYIKGLVLLIRPHVFLGWLRGPFLFIANTLFLTKWISRQQRGDILNDFYNSRREYGRRFELYKHISEKFNLAFTPFDYFEFGVAGGHSFRWWAGNSGNRECRFYGFDTFEGLPEDWGTFSKSDMASAVPVMDDKRVEFFKGLFQNTLPGFLRSYDNPKGKLKVIHLDADLFSATLFSLTSLAPYLNKGDILIFDEFNVPNHEFFAYRIFTESYYIKTKLIAAVNNYLQVALIVE
jgi:O-methyltransferase